jgi:hypothetical protein
MSSLLGATSSATTGSASALKGTESEQYAAVSAHTASSLSTSSLLAAMSSAGGPTSASGSTATTVAILAR